MVFEVPQQLQQLPAKLKENTPSSRVLLECARSNEFYGAQNPHTDFMCSFRSLKGHEPFFNSRNTKSLFFGSCEFSLPCEGNKANAPLI